MVSKICYFHPYLAKWSNLTHIFQIGLVQPPTSWIFVCIKSKILTTEITKPTTTKPTKSIAFFSIFNQTHPKNPPKPSSDRCQIFQPAAIFLELDRESFFHLRSRRSFWNGPKTRGKRRTHPTKPRVVTQLQGGGGSPLSLLGVVNDESRWYLFMYDYKVYPQETEVRNWPPLPI